MKNNKTKLNVLLGKTDYLAASYSTMLKEYSKYFKNSQGAFIGEKKTYTPREGTVDDPSKRKNVLIQTTVKEKIDWMEDTSKEYIDALFSVEKTNASGEAKADLVVDGETWGNYTSLELLRLKSLVESTDIKNVIENMPVRSDSNNWTKTENDMYVGREIYETDMVAGVEKTTLKESYVLEDPNISKLKDSGAYTPQVAVKNITQELGDYTHQIFSGETTQRKKAEALRRRSILLAAIVEALKKCNEVDVIESDLNAKKIFGYLFD